MYKVKSGLGNRPHRPLFAPYFARSQSVVPTNKSNGFISFCICFFSRVNKTIVKMKQFRLHTYSLEVVCLCAWWQTLCYAIANVCQNPYIMCWTQLATEWLEILFCLLLLAASRVKQSIRLIVYCIESVEHLCIAFANLRVCLWINPDWTNWCHLSLWFVDSHRAKNAGNATIWHSSTPEAKQCKRKCTLSLRT